MTERKVHRYGFRQASRNWTGVRSPSWNRSAKFRMHGTAACGVPIYAPAVAVADQYFGWLPARVQCQSCADKRPYAPGLSATPEMEAIVESLCVAVWRCAEDLRQRFHRDHRCQFDEQRRVCGSTLGEARCGRTPIAGGWGDWARKAARTWYVNGEIVAVFGPESVAVGERIVGDDLVVTSGCEAVHPDRRGGQHVAKMCTGVRITHRPTGISAVSTSGRSQRANKQQAARDLIDAMTGREDEGVVVPDVVIDRLFEMAGMPRVDGPTREDVEAMVTKAMGLDR